MTGSLECSDRLFIESSPPRDQDAPGTKFGHTAELTRRWKLEIPPSGVRGTFEKQRTPETSSTQASLLPGLRSGRCAARELKRHPGRAPWSLPLPPTWQSRSNRPQRRKARLWVTVGLRWTRSLPPLALTLTFLSRQQMRSIFFKRSRCRGGKDSKGEREGAGTGWRPAALPRPPLPARGHQGAPEQALRRFRRRGREAAARSP